jgi:hypothetical protein
VSGNKPTPPISIIEDDRFLRGPVPRQYLARQCGRPRGAARSAGRLGGFALDPLYDTPGRDDDELLKFPNVIMTPHIAAQPRFNALDDLAEMITGLATTLRE